MKKENTQYLLYDSPLRQPSQDRLGRANFAKFLAEAILKMDAEEGFVFALNGPWGSGKTTVINFVLHFIEKQKRSKQLLTVRFNPWWFSGREQLLQHFFKQMRAGLGGHDVPKDLHKISEKLDAFSKILAPTSFIPLVGDWTGKFKDLMQLSSNAAKKLSDALEKDIHAIRESIDSMLKKQKAKILVVIDDIDRLPAEEIRQIFQVVKAVADFPKTIYLLSFDREVVIKALSQIQGGTGEEYLEKIVQAPFDLPFPDRTSLRRLLFEQLDEIFAGVPESSLDPVEWGNIYWDGIDTFIRTPRDVKRFINILRPTFPIVKGEVNTADFLGIQALRLFAPEIFHFVVNSKDLLTGTEDQFRDRTRPEERRKPFDSILDTVPVSKRQPANQLMARLFPRWASAYGSIAYGSSLLPGWRKKLRICSPDIFERYFMLSIPLGDISSAEMRAILSQASDPKALGAQLIRLAGEITPNGTTRLRIFLERMEDFTENDIPNEQIEPILRTIYDIGDEVPNEEDKMGMFDYGNDMRLLRISYQLIMRAKNQEHRFELLRRIFDEAKSTSLVIQEIVMMCQEHGKDTEREPTRVENERIVAKRHLPEMEALGLQKIREAIKKGQFHHAPKFGHLLYRLSEWGSEKEAQIYVLDLIKPDEGLCDYIAGFLNASHSHGIDDRVSKRTWRMHIESVEKFLGDKAKMLLDRCERIIKESPNWLNARRRIALETFVRETKEPRDEWGRPKRDSS